jgi:hypothetical protein
MMCSVLTLSIGNNQRMVASSLARSSSRWCACSQSLSGKVCEAFWQAGDFIQDNEPQGNRVICHINDSIPEVIEAMRACVRETGASKLLSAIVTVDDPVERSLVASMSVSCKTRIRN